MVIRVFRCSIFSDSYARRNSHHKVCTLNDRDPTIDGQLPSWRPYGNPAPTALGYCSPSTHRTPSLRAVASESASYHDHMYRCDCYHACKHQRTYVFRFSYLIQPNNLLTYLKGGRRFTRDLTWPVPPVASCDKTQVLNLYHNTPHPWQPVEAACHFSSRDTPYSSPGHVVPTLQHVRGQKWCRKLDVIY